jgi:hypothetical protein
MPNAAMLCLIQPSVKLISTASHYFTTGIALVAREMAYNRRMVYMNLYLHDYENVLSQTVTNVQVDDGDSISIHFFFSIGLTDQGTLQVKWDNSTVLTISHASNSPDIVASAPADVRYHVQAVEWATQTWFTAMIRVPVSAATTSGLLSFHTPVDPTAQGFYSIDNIYIPAAGTCLPTFTCSEDQGIYLEEMYTTYEEYEGFFSGSKLWTVDYGSETITPLGVIDIEPNGTDFKNLNSIGYNPIDNYFWAHRVGTDQLVRIGNNLNTDLIRVPGLPTTYYTAGEVSSAGIFYLAYARNSNLGYNRIDRIDLTTPSPTLLSPIICDRNLRVLDFAISPIDGHLYGIADVEVGGIANSQLIKINVATGQVTTVATYPNSNIYGATLFHASFFDMHGNFYATTTDDNNNNITIRFEKVHLGGTPAYGYYGSSIFTNDGTSCRNEFPEFKISGNVWHDVDLDNQMDGIEPKTNLGTTYENGLWVNLVNSNDEVVAHVPVNLDGTYTIYTSDNNTGNYKLIVTETKINLGQILTTSSINNEWSYSGTEMQGVGANNTTGVINIILSGSSDLTDINFGVQQAPETDDHETHIANPGITTLVIGAGSLPQLSGVDAEDGIYNSIEGTNHNPAFITINSLPANGELLYQNIPVTVGQIITTYQSGDLTISVNGSQYEEVNFTYSYTDSKGIADATPNSYTINWADPLTVKLQDLYAKENAGNILLSWKTSTEQNNKGFFIEASLNGKEWETIGFESSQYVSGTGYELKTYQWIDRSPMGQKVYYRLQQVDYDNQATYTHTVSVSLSQEQTVSIYPNPASSHVVLKGLEAYSDIKVVDVQGRVILYQKVNPGQTIINIQHLRPGHYRLQIHSPSGKTSNHEIVKY